MYLPTEKYGSLLFTASNFGSIVGHCGLSEFRVWLENVLTISNISEISGVIRVLNSDAYDPTGDISQILKLTSRYGSYRFDFLKH